MIISLNACVHAKQLQSYLTLCDPMGCSPPGSSVQGILQARILECIVMPSSPGDLPYTVIKPTSSINFFLFWQKTALFKNHTLFFLFFFYPQEQNSFVQVFHIFHRNSNSLQDSTLLIHPHYLLLFHSKQSLLCQSQNKLKKEPFTIPRNPNIFIQVSLL